VQVLGASAQAKTAKSDGIRVVRCIALFLRWSRKGVRRRKMTVSCDLRASTSNAYEPSLLTMFGQGN
jgi:hypothetical protein